MFSNKARCEIKGDSSPEHDVVRSQSMAETAADSLFSEASPFHMSNFVREEEDDFQMISISRAGNNDGGGAEFSAGLAREIAPRRAKRAGRKELQGGTFRLKMIWFAGTGIIRANWEAINGEDIFAFPAAAATSAIKRRIGRFLPSVVLSPFL